ncbi:MAG: DUF1513 domain-containing protein [Rhizobiales bacterium]|nr:DUF1513 domain-containing protein [Hyphomicrobiales bacterium]
METPILIDRRKFLAGAASLVAALPGIAQSATTDTDIIFASGCKFSDGTFGAVLLNEQYEIVHSVPTSIRGHDLAFRPGTDEIVIFARRPGNLAFVADTHARTAPRIFTASPDRHFYGHGEFSSDGRLLYVSENDFDNALGKIGIYDATADYEKIGEFDSYGTGPHEVLMMPDGHTLAICNGGIETHPDFGRTKMNIESMKPSLVFMDSRSGDLLERHEAPPSLSQLSIRHMAITGRDTIYFGGQFEGNETRIVPLIGKCVRGEQIEFLDLGREIFAEFKQYTGSVTATSDGDFIAVSSPRGKLIATISTSSDALVARHQLSDGCGLASMDNKIVVTSGEGAIGTLGDHQFLDIAFDNHLVARKQT